MKNNEINYHKFSDFLVGKLNKKTVSDIKQRIAANVIVNWDAMAYHRLCQPNLTLNQVSNQSLNNNQLTYDILKYLQTENIVKKTTVKCDKTKNLFVYYSITDNFNLIKNDYIYRYESESWAGFDFWVDFYNIYNENHNLFEEIEYSFKFAVANYKHTEAKINKANKIKNDYILKISSERDFSLRFQMKEEVISIIENIIRHN